MGAVACHGRSSRTPNSTTQASCETAISRDVTVAGAAAELFTRVASGAWSSDPGPDASPADVRQERQRPIGFVAAAVRVVHEDRPPANVLPRHDPPVATVLRLVAVVAHHEVVAGGNEQRTPV